MTYTETRKIGGKKKQYRVYTYRKDGKVAHKRKYLGTDLKQNILRKKEKEADLQLTNPLNKLLNTQERFILEEIKKKHNLKHANTFDNRYEAFVSEFTYDSTGIEGNTLTLHETAAVLFEGAAPAKSLREVYEVLNHKKAFDYILKYKGNITSKFLCALQRIVTENTLKPEVANQIGKYRTVQVFIRGANIIPPYPKLVPKEMRSLILWYSKNKQSIHPLILAAYVHTAFESIHPFVDGNGRVGRLLLNFILHKNKYPMISVPRSRRLKYFKTLEKAQKGDIKPFVSLLIQLLKQTEKSI